MKELTIFSEKTETFILMFRHTLADDPGKTIS